MTDIEHALAKGFHILSSEMFTESRDKIMTELLKHEDYREIIFALTGIAAGELSEAIQHLGLKTEDTVWDGMTDEDRKAFVKKISDRVSGEDTLKHALDLVWLGVCIGKALEKNKSRNAPPPEIEEMISQIMKDSDFGVGECFLCRKRWMALSC